MAAAMQVSHHHLRRAVQHASHLQNRLKKVSAKTEEAFETVATAGLSAGTAAALGFLHGRHGPVEIVGVPLELIGGGALIGLSLFGVGGKWKTQMAAIGSGSLGVYAYNMAKGTGVNLKAKAGAETKVTGRLPSERLSAQEKAEINEPLAVQR